VLNEPVILVAGEMADVLDVSGYQVINRDDAMTLREQAIG
jgi:hypothetical protein